MRVKILNRCWDLVFKAGLPKDCDGECDPPTRPGKQIRVRVSLRGEARLSTLIHEALHAFAFDHLDESVVDKFGNDLARILWRLGYRGPEDKETPCVKARSPGRP